jgi:hypothetical protein
VATALDVFPPNQVKRVLVRTVPSVVGPVIRGAGFPLVSRFHTPPVPALSSAAWSTTMVGFGPPYGAQDGTKVATPFTTRQIRPVAPLCRKVPSSGRSGSESNWVWDSVCTGWTTPPTDSQVLT